MLIGKLFDEKKEFIRKSEGCRLLELYQEQTSSNVFFTYSYWDSENDLENYRHSDLFKNTWSKTKVLFNEKPQAWSLNKIISLN